MLNAYRPTATSDEPSTDALCHAVFAELESLHPQAAKNTWSHTMFHTGLDGSCLSCHAGRWIATLNCSRSTVHWERLCIYNCARALNVEAERLNFSFGRPNVRIGERIVASDRMSSAWLNWHRNT